MIHRTIHRVTPRRSVAAPWAAVAVQLPPDEREQHPRHRLDSEDRLEVRDAHLVLPDDRLAADPDIDVGHPSTGHANARETGSDRVLPGHDPRL